MQVKLSVNPEPINPMCGYPYIYTPHRDYARAETKEYSNLHYIGANLKLEDTSHYQNEYSNSILIYSWQGTSKASSIIYKYLMRYLQEKISTI